jgi:hypothetical protein
MIHFIKEKIGDWQARRQRWNHYKHQASKLSVADLEFYAAGHGFNLLFAKACKQALRLR